MLFRAYEHHLPKPEEIAGWSVYSYQFIDELQFMPPVEEAMERLPWVGESVQALADLFRAHGWEGDGTIQVMWLPPVVLPTDHYNNGLILFHVKQSNNGMSYIATPYPMHREYPFLGEPERRRA